MLGVCQAGVYSCRPLLQRGVLNSPLQATTRGLALRQGWSPYEGLFCKESVRRRLSFRGQVRPNGEREQVGEASLHGPVTPFRQRRGEGPDEGHERESSRRYGGRWVHPRRTTSVLSSNQ